MVRWIAATLLVLTLFACGSGGGGTNENCEGLCSSTAYTPNYVNAPSLTLRKWKSLPIKVYFETSTPIGLTTIENLTKNGFDKWELALSHDLWTETNVAADADLVVKVEEVSPQTTLASTTVYFNCVTITQAKMTVYTWPSIPASNYDPTGCHEMGHALGIGGHSQDNQDIMYFTGNSTGLLTTPDLNTLRTCYCDFATSAMRPLAKTKIEGPIQSETTNFPHK